MKAFNATKALLHARACALSYRPDADRALLDELDCHKVRPLNFGDWLLLIAERADGALLVFRGTDTIGGWITDVDAVPEAHPAFPGMIHAGFASVWDDIVSWLLTYAPKDKPVDVTGHSAGGALATMALWALKDRGYRFEDQQTTFGAPRFADAVFAGQFGAAQIPLYRVVHDLDVVPHLPPPIHFAHVGEEIRLWDDGTLGAEPGWWTRLRRFGSHLRRGAIQMVCDALEDHRIDGDVLALTAAVSRIDAASKAA